MEDHQEFEKPIFELHPRKARSSRNKKKNGLVESMNHHHYEEIFCYYGLRGSPKRTTTQKSLRIRKRLIRCGECEVMCRGERDPKEFPEMNQTECEDEQKLVGKLADGSMSNRRSKELLGFLGDKKVMKEDESGQKQKQVGAESFGEQVRLERVSLDEMLKKAESDTGQKLGGQEAVFEASNAAASKGNNEHRCRVCERVFSTYQALGGHQTVHRMKNNSEKSKHEMQRRVSSRS
ncbi:C2H2 and C2HC zinc fingers superfamily protein [Raphanus sativus]|nr:C2H2 and C2HC zinc fingers superfamily protein [Raphanus sativus]